MELLKGAFVKIKAVIFLVCTASLGGYVLLSDIASTQFAKAVKLRTSL
jgi:hypothetical protein